MNKIVFYILITSLFLACERKGRPRVPQPDSRDVQIEIEHKPQPSESGASRPPKENYQPERRKQSTKVNMTEHSGVYEVPIEVNGQPMNFILDTGASNISISQTEANFLYKNGQLTKEDILGNIEFIDATGKISTGTSINLRKVKIGDRILKNVSASVVNNINAPLLLGQSALSQFGKITLDYNHQQLIIE